jgi:hypothetical protein
MPLVSIDIQNLNMCKMFVHLGEMKNIINVLKIILPKPHLEIHYQNFDFISQAFKRFKCLEFNKFSHDQ